MDHPRYELKQRDRHMLFRYVSPYEEEPKMNFSDFSDQGKQFIYKNFYRAAERRGCCGCLWYFIYILRIPNRSAESIKHVEEGNT